MSLSVGLLSTLSQGPDREVWRILVERALEIASRPLTADSAAKEVARRDREIGELDLFLSSSGWDLWQSFGQPENGGFEAENKGIEPITDGVERANGSVERTSERLIRWWAESFGAKAVLILDGLSLRELPWLLQGAKARGFTLHEIGASASELPGETDEFARALGFSGRSQLQNNGARSHKLQPARTEAVNLPWKDCAALVNNELNQIFWHHWPDVKLHDGSGAGQGLEPLTQDAAAQLCSEDFWGFVARLATGRRLVITSDHGYAASGLFADAEDKVGQFLKQTFASGRNRAEAPSTSGDRGPFAPPVALRISNAQGTHLMALGRRKWRSQGGYPTLTHGGLSLLEVLSPFVELTR